jgi:fatty-acyl-CoA synthase
MPSESTFTGPPPKTEQGIGSLTFGGFLDEVTAKFGDRPALLWAPPDGRRTVWSYSQLRDQAWAVAKGLVAAGVSRGTRVIVLMGSRPEWVASVWGAVIAGGVAVPANTFMQKRELDHLLRSSDASIVVAETELLNHHFVSDIMELCPEASTAAPGLIWSAAYPFLRHVVAVDSTSHGAVRAWADFLGSGAGVPDDIVEGVMRETVPTEDGIIIYSSGSTSLPKGVLHRHRAPVRQMWRHGFREQYDPEDRVYSAIPLFWSAGFAAVMGAAFASGACLVLSSYFDADYTLDLIEKERITVVQCGDNQAAEIRAIQETTRRDLSSIRRSLFRFTGPLLPPGSPRPANRASYGSSETFTSATGLPDDAPPDERTTYGRLTAGTNMRILDRQTGEPLGVGEEGEMILKGLTVMRGYVKVSPEDTFDDEGFFHTGDLGWFDEKGLLHFTGRLANVIKTGGANVGPLEVEAQLLSHPDIQRAVVVGVPDPTTGELVVAAVVPRPGAPLTEEMIQKYLRDLLSTYKVPRRVLFFASEDELPRTGSDKINLPALRNLAAKMIAAEP